MSISTGRLCFFVGISVGVMMGALMNVRVASSIYLTESVTVLPSTASVIVNTNSLRGKSVNDVATDQSSDVTFLPPVPPSGDTESEKDSAISETLGGSGAPPLVINQGKQELNANPVVTGVLKRIKDVQNTAIEVSHSRHILDRPLHLPPENQPDSRKKPLKMVLLRAIGNALPPRHDPEQAIRNLNFTLMHEPDYPHVHKHWVLNRLVDEDLEMRLIHLLESFEKKYTRIPFELDVYDTIPYDFEMFQAGTTDLIHSQGFHTGSLGEKQYGQVEEAISNAKNLYVTNQNGCRNKMLDIGIEEYPDADWILPWDGNCFVHPNAFESIVWGLHNHTKKMPKQKYFVTPMNRALENEDTLFRDYHPEPIEEPQIIFHRTAEGRFQPNLRYGRRNKVEMIMRVKVKGPWDKWSPYLEWEKEALGPLFEQVPDLHKPAPTIGWTTRLSSGHAHLETKGTIHARGISRVESIILLLSKLDARAAKEIHNFDTSNLLFYDEAALQRDRELFEKKNQKSKVHHIMDELLALAEDSLEMGPWSVTDKPKGSVAPSNDPHDYYHPAPYYWPVRNSDGTIDEKAKYERRDGQRVPGTVLYDEMSDLFDRTRLTAMQYNTTTLALAYYMTGRKEFGKVAARNIRTFFLDPKTRMNPNMAFAQVRRNHNNNAGFSFGIIENKDLYFMLDAVRIVERGGFFTKKESAGLRDWFRKYMEWVETSSMGIEEYTASNNHGLYYDIQLIALSAFVDNTSRMLWYLDRSLSRMLLHIADNGSMPHEMKRPICEHYQMFTLQGWATLARMGEKVGRNLWEVYPRKLSANDKEMSALCRAAYFSVPFFRDRDVCKAKSPIDNVERWWPLLQDSRTHCPELKDDHWPQWFPKDATTPPGNVYDMPNLFNPHDGIAPFWNLGLSHSDKSHKQPKAKKTTPPKAAGKKAKAPGHQASLQALHKQQKKQPKASPAKVHPEARMLMKQSAIEFRQNRKQWLQKNKEQPQEQQKPEPLKAPLDKAHKNARLDMKKNIAKFHQSRNQWLQKTQER